MTNREMDEISNPLEGRLLNASEQLSELDFEREGDILVTDSLRQINVLRANLSDSLGEITDSKDDLKSVVLQLDTQLNAIRDKLRQEGFSLYF